MAQAQNGTKAATEEPSVQQEKRWIRKQAGKLFLTATRAILKTAFRLKVSGLENIEAQKGKPMVIVANHTSMLDGAILAAALPVDAMYAIDTHQYEKFSNHWLMGSILSSVEMHTLDHKNTKSVNRMTEQVKAGKPLVIFPEGTLTDTGSFMPVHPLPAQIAARANASVIPAYMNGLNFMPFASVRLQNHPWRFFPRLSVTVLKPQKISLPGGVDAGRAISNPVREKMRRDLEAIMHAMPVRALNPRQSLMEALYDAAANYGWSRKMLDGSSRRQFSYSEIVAGSIALGKKLAAVTEPDESVGLLLPAVEAATFAFFGLHNEGRVVAPLNLLHESARMISCADTVKMKTVLTSRKLVEGMKLEKQIEALAVSGRNIVYLEDINVTITGRDKLAAFLQARIPFLRPHRYKSGEELAAIIFTSGSTAEPKGVCLSSQNFLANIAQSAAVMPLTPSDRIFNVMPPFHSFGAGVMIMAMMRGIPLFQYPFATESKNVAEAFFNTRATVLFASDSMAFNYAKAAKPGYFRLGSKIFVGAEKMTKKTVDLFWNKHSVIPFEGYGATEASPALAFNIPAANKFGTVGRPLPGVEIKWEDGEYGDGKLLTFRGPNRMMGYMFHDHPGEIRAPDSSHGFPPEAFYNTNDVASIDDEGHITLHDRAGNFIKVGGEMIPGAMIEKIASSASAKKDFQHAVFHVGDVEDKRFVLYTTDSGMTRSRMVKAAAEIDMKPNGIPADSDIIYIEKLPRLAVGKVNVQELKRLYNEIIKGSLRSSSPDSRSDAPSNLSP